MLVSRILGKMSTSTRKCLHFIMFSKIYLWKWMLLMRSKIWYQHNNFPVGFYIFHRRVISVNFYFESRRHFFSISDGIFCQLLKRISIHQYALKYIANIIFTKINPLTAKYVYLSFSSIVWFLQFLSHFLWVLEARSKLTQFHTKFWVNRARFLAS